MVQHREGELHAAVYSPDGTQVLQDAVPLAEGQDGGSSGAALALRLLEAGAEPLLLLARKEYQERDE